MKSNILSFYLLSLLLLGTQAWWETGHMLVAQVAKQELLAKNPALYSRAEDIALFVKGLTDGLSDSFIESAVWMDDVKLDEWDNLFNWHFVDRPVDPLGLSNGPLPSYDSLYAVNETLHALNSTSNLNQTTLTKSFYLRILMHVIGDMHQPLHNAMLFNKTYPIGDLGGNLVTVFVESVNNSMPLHSYWDSVAQSVPNAMTRPLSAENVSTLEQLAKNFTNEFPRAALQDRLNVTDMKQWTIDCYQDAVDSAYGSLRSDLVIDDAYHDQAFAVMRRNIALGGYRLADLIGQALKGEMPSVTVQEAEAEVDVFMMI